MISSITKNPGLFWPSAGSKLVNNTQSTSFSGAFAASSLNIQSNMVSTMKLYSDPDFVYAPQEPGGGYMSISTANMLISVYKSENYSEDNPVMLVKGINSDETRFEVEINIKDINPKSASLVELAALEGHDIARGKKDSSFASSYIPSAMLSQQLFGNRAYIDSRADAFTKMDFIPALSVLMEMQRANSNWDGYMRFKQIIDALLGGS